MSFVETKHIGDVHAMPRSRQHGGNVTMCGFWEKDTRLRMRMYQRSASPGKHTIT
ncbi:MAG: hypothetical protein IJI14_04410 [Anaerolineaceae bacterium]|nr:hypothetical protein [Anaerolineaceae bacterium]